MNHGRSLPVLHGRGTAVNPPNRFETLRIEADFEHVEGDEEYLDRLNRPVTQYLVDTSQSIIASNDSPDVGFSHSINPYRGCQHGCIYCYARPGHEYLGFSAGLDFETRIMVKPRAAELLREELASPRWKPTLLAMSGVTDCYQPIEKTLRVTRACLEVLAECRNPVGVITKNHLVTRDIDLLSELAKFDAARVFVSVTTLDEKLTAKMEPRTSVPKRRLAAIEALAKAGIAVGVLMAPIVPGLTDHEIPSVLKAAAEAGAHTAGYTALRLPGAVAPLFEQWLEQHFPDRKEKVLNRVRSMRGGKLNDPNFGSRMSGQGIWAEQIKTVFELAKRKAGLDRPLPRASVEAFRRPVGKSGQVALWE
jgi:DNA repair photolyase